MKPVFEQLNAGFLNKARKLSRLTCIIQQFLPLQAHGHFHVVNVKQGILYIVADSPVWATRLRQSAPELLKSINHDSSNINTDNNIYQQNPGFLQHIKVLTRPGKIAIEAHEKQHKRTGIHRHISPKTASLLTQTAEFIRDDKLRESLERLAMHVSDK